MVSWDNKNTLRIFLCALNGGFALIRQSNIFSKGETAGAATAEGAHTDMAPISIEMRVRREVAARVGCSEAEALQVSNVNVLAHQARGMGVSRDDITDDAMLGLIEDGTLHYVRMWTSPNSAAKPLAFLDCSTVDYSKYLSGDGFLHGFEQGETFPDYTKFHTLANFLNDKKLGQLQLSYHPDPSHRWYFFQDLAEDEVCLFGGADYTFHTAFTPAVQSASEERLSAEMGAMCMIVKTEDQACLDKCANFLSSVRNKDGQPVFGMRAGRIWKVLGRSSTDWSKGPCDGNDCW